MKAVDGNAWNRPGSAGSLLPYEAIHAHAELELELAGRGELDRLLELAPRWAELTRCLPESPPPAAAPLLRTAHALHERTRCELIRLREALLADAGASARARRAARGYAAQRIRHPQLDRSA